MIGYRLYFGWGDHEDYEEETLKVFTNKEKAEEEKKVLEDHEEKINLLYKNKYLRNGHRWESGKDEELFDDLCRARKFRLFSCTCGIMLEEVEVEIGKDFLEKNELLEENRDLRGQISESANRSQRHIFKLEDEISKLKKENGYLKRHK